MTELRHSIKSFPIQLTSNNLLHCIQVLYELPVTVLHLETTGIGRTIHALRKIDNGVGHYAKRLTTKWKEMIIASVSSDEEDEEDEPESNSETVKDERTKAKSNTYNKRKYESSSSYEEGSYKKKKLSERTDGEEVVQSNNTVVDNPLSDEEEHSKDKDSSLKDQKYCDKVKTKDKNHHSSSSKYKLHESDGTHKKDTKPLNQIDDEPEYQLSKKNSAELKREDLMLAQVMCTKNARTKVFSGNKSSALEKDSSLHDGVRSFKENIDAIKHTGGVPFSTLKRVMEQAKPDQLLMLEHQNPHLIGETDYLWQFHCQKNFRTKEREEMETWRDMYTRCFDEREAKLKVLTANIKKSIDKSTRVRTTKFVDNIIKPPCKVSRKQAKFGPADLTAKNDVKKTLNSLPVGNSGSSGSSANIVKKISVPPPTTARMRHNSAVKKTKAPMMTKVF